MKLTNLAFSALLLLGTASYATDKAAACECDKGCEQSCAEGHGEKCECKACDCAKTGKCEHGKCEHHKHEKKAAKKDAAAKETKK